MNTKGTNFWVRGAVALLLSIALVSCLSSSVQAAGKNAKSAAAAGGPESGTWWLKWTWDGGVPQDAHMDLQRFGALLSVAIDNGEGGFGICFGPTVVWVILTDPSLPVYIGSMDEYGTSMAGVIFCLEGSAAGSWSADWVMW